MSNSRTRARHRVLAVVAGAGIAAASLSTAGAVSAAPQDQPAPTTARSAPSGAAEAAPAAGQYIIAFTDPPAAGYRGGVPGFAATAPARGQRFDSSSPAVQRYRARLSGVHADALAAVGAQAFHDYTVAFNGVAADLTARQALALSKDPRVLHLVEDGLSQPTTDSSPDVLGLPDGLWADAGGRDNAGAGVIVGVIDTGIWPENPSFAGSAEKRSRAGRPVPAAGIRKTWRGACEAGEQFTVQDCDDKLVGARYYVDGFGRADVAHEEFLSPRDGDGHGSHTASTAAGNRVDGVVVDGRRFGTVSGMAPAAQIAAYKVCWTGKTGAGCATSDSVAAIDDAVADGVDVINYSIGSSSESAVHDPVEIAFLHAAAAGVFVAASAGNSGPGASTLDHPSPWLTTVAASTHKVSERKLVLGDGTEIVGSSTTGELDETPMALAVDAAAAGVDAAQAAICNTGTLDPAKVGGKLVVCERRGIIARTTKSQEVKRAGGAGMVLINNPANSLNGDLHAVPTVHLQADALTPVTAHVRAGGTGAIRALEPGDSTTATPEVIAFSSRGPSTTTGGDILKPDLAAPGVDVLAAVAPPTHHGRDFDLMSGTSMAAPHVAGLAALVRQAQPRWSPMAVKSALMTTAGDHVTTRSPFEQGAGFVRPNGATDPGVVFDHGLTDWAGYLETAVGRDLWSSVTPLDGSQLNQASIAIGQLPGTETVRRTLTDVSGAAETYRLSAELDGVDVTFSAQSVTVPAGGSASVDITFTRTTATYGRYVTGSLTATGDAGHTVRLPLAVRPVAAAVDPAEVRGTGASGTASVTVTPGFTGTMSASVTGLVGVTPEADSVPTGSYADAFDPLAPADHASVDVRDLEVGDDVSLLRLAVDAADGDDLDLWLYRVEGGRERLVGYSATGSGDEQVTLLDPAPGAYRAYVHGWGVPVDGGYSWSQWLLSSGAEGDLVVDPAEQTVITGRPTTFGVAWTDLDPAQRYLGWVGFHEGDTLAGRTIVSVG